MKIINVLKGVIFYLTIIMGCITLGIDYYRTPGTTLLLWFTILACLGFTTYKMCVGKTSEEIKEFTGIIFEE